MNRSFRSLLVAAALLAAAPAAANAAATVNVSVGATDVAVPTTQSYAYSMSFDSTPDRYTVEVVKPDGGLVAPRQTVTITGKASPVGGENTLPLPADAPEGYYTVKVAYYAAGQSDWEGRAQKVFRVTRPVAPSQPAPTPEPQPTTTQPAPTPEQRPAPQPTVTLPPQSITATPVIGLTKTVDRKIVKAGKTATFTLTVSNRGTVAARNVKVCDTVPARMTVTKLGTGRFENGKLCFTVGTLAVDASKSIKVQMRVDADAPKGTIVNRATATADDAATVKASAKVTVKRTPRPRTAAPVTG